MRRSSDSCIRSEGKLEDTLCYPITRQISSFLDRKDVREKIGVDPSITTNFSSCNNAVGARFAYTQDHTFPTQYYIAALLERGVRVLLYVGDYDWICNWVS